MRGRPFTGEEITLNRVCAICGSRYTLAQADTHFFTAPYNYRNGCAATCLKCWLGCGPDDKDEILPGNLLKDFALTLGPESHLVLMPIYRLMVSEPIRFQSKSIIYPHRIPKLDELNLVLSDKVSKSLTAFQSSATFVDKQTLLDTPTIAFTYGFDWDDLWHSNRHGQMEYLRRFSQIADMKCLNWIRYRLCRIGVPDTLPSRAGQIKKETMFSAALVFNAFRGEGGIIAGDAFGSAFTKGLGLPIDEEKLLYNDFPDQDGEVGIIALYALDLYATILQAEYPTAQFTQLMGLLEFLADPTDYTKAEDVGKIIGRYVATNAAEYAKFKARYHDLSGKQDPNTREYTGYRTRIVHMGQRLEDILPAGPRNELLQELDTYVRTVIDHMIERSSWTFDSYKQARLGMTPFLK
jgi:hypothetical protein